MIERCSRTTIFVISFVAMTSLAWGSIAKIHLLDQAMVAPQEVTLGDLASIEGDKAVVEQLRDMEIAQAPKVGQKGAISSYRLKSMLQDSGLQDVEVLGLQSTFITESRTLSPQELSAQASEWIQSLLPEGTEAALSFQGLNGSWEVPNSEETSIEFELLGNRLSSSVSLVAKAYVRGSLYARKNFRASVSLFRDVAVLSKPVKRKSLIRQEDVELRREDVTQLRGMEIASLQDVVGMVAKRSLPMNEVLTVRDLETPVLIEKGDLSQIFIRNGSVNMTIAGAEAMQDGKEGDLVRFKNPMNPKTTLQARVVRQGVAQIIIR